MQACIKPSKIMMMIEMTTGSISEERVLEITGLGPTRTKQGF